MGYDNGRTSERIYSDLIKKEYFSIQEACDIVNKELDLSIKDTVIPETVFYWRKKGLITFRKNKGSRIKITEKELRFFKGFVFLHVLLGISFDKLYFVRDYFKNINSSWKIQEQINLYTTYYDKNN